MVKGSQICFALDDMCSSCASAPCAPAPTYATRGWCALQTFADITEAADYGGLTWSDIHNNGYSCEAYCSLTCKCTYYDDGREPDYILPIAEAMRWWGIQVRQAMPSRTIRDARSASSRPLLELLMLDCFWYSQIIMFGTLSVYVSLVVPGTAGYGRAQPWYFFVQPSYWCPTNVQTTPDTSTNVVEDEAHLNEDVRDETRRVLTGGADEDAIKVVNLGKTFASCCSATFTAIYRVNVGIAHNTLFCLLGHNGAGKTTTFNMLSGMFQPTCGDAFVFGHSVRKQLRAVQALMGICPQHDILWPELSGQEHLQLFAGLAGLPLNEVKGRVASYLRAVDLTASRQKASKFYSGGMRRRLSVACSLIAGPKVVYLDEPTTGMDPVNRRGEANTRACNGLAAAPKAHRASLCRIVTRLHDIVPAGTQVCGT